ncbi:MAG: UDP-N-acetylmuramoyl-tripeptide--D-alanyl-D-alanine ligase [Chloroflexota bacterium]|nr:UDP-N-acetylmuramoyl-tripeptide--D-alanyl-D-alanine ligase [Chloroflexota bacterium]
MIEFADIVASMKLPGSVDGALPSLHDQAPFSAVAIDSRQVTVGDLFVALPGEHVDGHQFVGDALRRGARGALVRRDWAAGHVHELDQSVALLVDGDSLALVQPGQQVVFAVDDPLATLQQLSAIHRRRMPARMIGITGSVGKTSTKEATAAVLRQGYKTHYSGKSYNNEIGVPLTLLGLQPEHEVAVVEMGTYGPGEIALLCRLAQPMYGIVTNVGVSHLDRMKTQAVIAQSKGELVEALPADGVAILNGDDVLVRGMATRTAARPLFYGFDPGCELWADQVENHGLGGVSFTAHYAGEARRVDVPLLGRHAVYIALPSIAAGLVLGLPWDAICAGLRDGGLQSRLVVVRGVNGATILDDSYNAAPASCKAALDVLAAVPGRRIAVFGDMAELGPVEESGHREVGIAAAGVVERLVVVGNKARWIGEAAREQPNAPEVDFARSNAEAVDLLKPLLAPSAVVLVKGARVAQTEEIVNGLRAQEVGR